MPRFNAKAFGERLRSALEERGWDVKTLQKAVHRETGGARGTSYGSVWSYVNGRAPVEPRREVIEALAKLMERLPEFLLHGEGPMSERAQQVQEARKTRASRKDDAQTQFDERYQAMAAGMTRPSSAWDMAGYFYATEPLLQGLVIDFLESGGEDFLKWSTKDIEEAAFFLFSLIAAPAQALRPREPKGATRVMEKWPEYFTAMSMAIRAAFPSKGRGQPRETLTMLRAFKESIDQRIPTRGSSPIQ